LTFDIEEWYHLYKHPEKFLSEHRKAYRFSLEKETIKIFHILEEKNLKATFFWLGEEAKKYPSLLRELNNGGHEIGVHSFSHAKIGETSRNIFRFNTERAVKTIEDITGEKVKSYRAPVFSLAEGNLWALEILKELGIEYDSSTVIKRYIGSRSIPSAPFLIRNQGIIMKEFPVSSFSLLGLDFKYGSGYFRISPYKSLNHKLTTSPYVMSYFHPRDFDKSIHRKIEISPYLKMKYRIGTQRALHNLIKLSGKTSWTSVREAAEKVDWDKADILEF
jgi:polysaccharide deacetylase family protein (PEP-CTERM system associated)